MTVLALRAPSDVEVFAGPRVVRAPQRPPASDRPSRFRADIHGLRAVAVALVVAYHAKVPGVGGGFVGVDTFFVISGFLITGQLVRGAAHGSRPRLISFYAKRVRRLLPSAALVVVVTVIAARLWAPPLQLVGLRSDSWWTAVYGINYHLAAVGVDYQHAGAAPSPLQHFWSLAVEEQFYVVWPILITVCCVVRHRWRTRVFAVVLIGLVSASLWLSFTQTRSDPTLAYFSLGTRAWELGLGGLVALAASFFARLPKALAGVVSWVGLLAVVGSAFVYDDNTRFPGLAALWPVLGAAAVIAGGCAEPRRGARVLLRRRPLQGLGAVSYSWYLWHWPFLVLAPMIVGEHFGWIRNLEMMVLALWFAIITHLCVEKPAQLRLRLGWRGLGVGAALSGLVVSSAWAAAASEPALVGRGPVASSAIAAVPAGPDYIAQVERLVATGATTKGAPSNLRPSVSVAVHDLPASTTSPGHCHANFLVITQGPCVYGDPLGSKTMVIFGDSHAEQWLPAFDAVGRATHWRVINWTKAACPAAQVTISNPQLGRVYRECDTWRTKTLDRIRHLHPNLVVVSQSNTVIPHSFDDQTVAYKTFESLGALTGHGVPVDYLLDTPYPDVDVPSCVSSHLGNVHVCGRRDYAIASDLRSSVIAATLRGHGVRVVDPHPWLCGADFCPAVVGDLLVYRDDSHMSATYSRWLSPLVQGLLVGH